MVSTTSSDPVRSPSARERFGTPAVWFAFLGGPAAWTAHFLGSYGLVYFPCDVRLWFLLLLTAAAVLVAIAAAIVSVRLMQRSPATRTDAQIGGRNEFVGFGGLLLSVLFLLIILVQGVTPLVLGQCG